MVNLNIRSCYCLAVFILLFFGIHYTADWENYEYFILNPEVCPDYLYRYFVYIFSDYEIGYGFLFKIHVLLMALVYVFLARLIIAIPEISIIYAIEIYLLMANQIRFYLAWPLMLLAIYVFYRKKYILFIILSVISVLSHQATAIVIVVVLVCDFVFRRLSFGKFLCLLLSLSAFLTFFICFCLDDERINHYKMLHSQATILGGMWNELPFVICILIVARIHNIVLSVRPYVCHDIKYRYLFCLSMSVVLFLGVGFYLQTCIQRYVESMLLIWMMYIIYCYRIIQIKRFKMEFIQLFFIVIGISPIFSLLYYVLTGKDYSIDELIKMFSSYNIFM